jgi:uncharacterized integral membrane protein
MAGATSDSAVPEQPEQSEPTIEEIRASNKGGLWVLLARGALALIIVAVVGVKGIFDRPWR